MRSTFDCAGDSVIWPQMEVIVWDTRLRGQSVTNTFPPTSIAPASFCTIGDISSSWNDTPAPFHGSTWSHVTARYCADMCADMLRFLALNFKTPQQVIVRSLETTICQVAGSNMPQQTQQQAVSIQNKSSVSPHQPHVGTVARELTQLRSPSTLFFCSLQCRESHRTACGTGLSVLERLLQTTQ